MKINQIELKNFRNYEKEIIKFSSGTNVFIGQNAQGKTNILEAIYLCASARSHRTGKDIELIKDGHSFYQVKINFDGEELKDQSLKIEYRTEPRLMRDIYYCDIKQDKIGDLFGLFHAVIFAPEDLMLIKDGPSVRRRFLDVLISQIRPLYFRNLQLFQQYLRQRNQLLKTLKEMLFQKKINPKSFQAELYDFNLIQLSIWTEKLAETETEIILMREKYIEKIQQYAGEALATISDQTEKLKINYKTISNIDTKADKKTIYKQLLNRYENQRDNDIQRGNTGSGTHRDDLEIYVNDNLLKERGSQGQQRSAVLSIKLAELKIIENETQEKPVLLLDDVMSELDEKRRVHLFSAFEDNQVFITCTELAQIYPKFKGKLIDAEENSQFLEEKDNDKYFDHTELTEIQVKTSKNSLKSDLSLINENGYIHFYKIDKGTVKSQILV